MFHVQTRHHSPFEDLGRPECFHFYTEVVVVDFFLPLVLHLLHPFLLIIIPSFYILYETTGLRYLF